MTEFYKRTLDNTINENGVYETIDFFLDGILLYPDHKEVYFESIKYCLTRLTN
jgi:hypothetical protein